MGFVKTNEEMAKNRFDNPHFYDAEMLLVFFVTRPEVPQRLLPPPLKTPAMPLGYVFIANYPRTSIGISYLESALVLAAEFEGEMGLYCLSMPVTNDMALILGRETFGYPKKMANISLSRHGSEVTGMVERHGVRVLDVRATLTGTFNDEAAMGMMKARLEGSADTIIFNHKYFPAPGGAGFDYNPRLVREAITSSRKSLEFGRADIILGSSDHDPWKEVEVVKVIGATYTVSDNTMLPGTVVAEVDHDNFAPYAFMKLDALS